MGFFESNAKKNKRNTAASFKSSTKKENKKKVKKYISSSNKSSSMTTSKKRSHHHHSSSSSSSSNNSGFNIGDIGKNDVTSYAPPKPKSKPKPKIKTIKKNRSNNNGFNIRDIGKNDVTSYAPPKPKNKTIRKNRSNSGDTFDNMMSAGSNNNGFNIRDIGKNDVTSYAPPKPKNKTIKRNFDFFKKKALPRVDFFESKKDSVFVYDKKDNKDIFDKPLLSFGKTYIDKADDTRTFTERFFGGKIKDKITYRVDPTADEDTQFVQIKRMIAESDNNTPLGNLKYMNDNQLRDYIKGDVRLLPGGGSVLEGGVRKNLETGKLEEVTDATISKIDILTRLDVGEGVDKNKQTNKDVNDLFKNNEKYVKQLGEIDNKYKEITNNGKKSLEYENIRNKNNINQELINREWDKLNAINTQFETQKDLDDFNKELARVQKLQDAQDKQVEKDDKKINLYLAKINMLEDKSENVYNKYIDNLNKLKSKKGVIESNGNYQFTPLPEKDFNVDRYITSGQQGGNKIELSDNEFIRNLNRGYRGKDIYGVKQLEGLDAYTAPLGQLVGRELDMFSLGLLETTGVMKNGGGGAKDSIKTVTGVFTDNEDTKQKVADFAKFGGNVVATYAGGKAIAGTLSSIGVGTRAVGGNSAFMQAIGRGASGAGKFTSSGTDFLAEMGVYGMGGTLAGSTATQYALSSKDKNLAKNKLKKKYNFNVIDARKKYVNDVSKSNLAASQFPGPTAYISSLTSKKTFEIGEDSINQYLNDLNIYDKNDRAIAKILIMDEVTSQQIGETGGLVGGISAFTERLGQKILSESFGKAGVIGAEVGAKKIVADKITKQSVFDIGKLGIGEGASSTITTAGSRGEKLNPYELAINSVVGGVSAGLTGGMVVSNSVRKGLDLKPTFLNKVTPSTEFTANVLDLGEKPGDLLQALRNKVTGQDKVPTVIKTNKNIKLSGFKKITEKDTIPGVLKPKNKLKTTQFELAGIQPKGLFGQLKARVVTPSTSIGTNTGTQTGVLTNIKSLTSTESQSIFNTPMFTPSNTLTKTNTNLFTPSNTPSNTLTNIFTPASTPSNTAANTPSDILTSTTSTSTKTNIPIFTPQNGAAIFPGFGNARGWGWGSGNSKVGFKINPLQSIKMKGYLPKKSNFRLPKNTMNFKTTKKKKRF